MLESNPVSCTVQLLHGLSDQAEKDGKMEEKLFEKFVCWAKTVISSKTATNKAAQSLMETLEAYIADIDAIRVEFTTERVDLEKDLEEVNFAIEEAAALRKRENEDFLAAAFAQFGSDLDASTQHQLLRGGILTELLKPKQFVPMMTQEIIVSLWAGTRVTWPKSPPRKSSASRLCGSITCVAPRLIF